MMLNNCIVLVSNRKYQRYLDFMLWQLGHAALDIFVICENDVILKDNVHRIDPNNFCIFGDISTYPSNTNLNGALYKLLIPYIPAINSHDKALFLDLDIRLFDGWTVIFEQEQQRPILAARDIGINWQFAAYNNMLDFYDGRNFEYANTGVMLFDFKKWDFGVDNMRKMIDVAFERKWLYSDQDILNAAGVIDCSLDRKFNTFSHLTTRDTLISHYTAAVDAKDRFNALISAEMTIVF